MLGQPPYEPSFNSIAEVPEKIRALSFDNYAYFFSYPLYWKAYLSSVWIAAVSTAISLLVGYPIAYGMARARRSIRPILVMLVILPFWTSFLIRVYAWIGILKPEGLLNQFLLWLGLIDQPLIITNTNWAVYHRHRLFLPAVHGAAALCVAGKARPHALEAAADLGSPPLEVFLADHLPALASRRHRRIDAGLHPRRRRVRHPRPARRIEHADDRQDALGRVLP